ncbi:MAG TPA: flavin reductase family protein [Polyangiaceae bacterium]|nr:flavin reductase family protein [Polyangiaceae bacterium]
MAIDGHLFRAVLGSFPTGVTIVTTVAGDGVPRGVTCNAICSVSADPPLLLFCLAKKAGCLPAVLERKAFVVNFLAVGRGDLSTRFASPIDDKFAGVQWQPSTLAGGSPILTDDIVAHAECTLSQVVDAGDHQVLIGLVVGGSANGGSPLMYLRRMYAAWPDPEPAPRGEQIHG